MVFFFKITVWIDHACNIIILIFLRHITCHMTHLACHIINVVRNLNRNMIERVILQIWSKIRQRFSNFRNLKNFLKSHKNSDNNFWISLSLISINYHSINIVFKRLIVALLAKTILFKRLLYMPRKKKRLLYILWCSFCFALWLFFLSSQQVLGGHWPFSFLFFWDSR